MKKLTLVFLVALLLALTACGRDGEVWVMTCVDGASASACHASRAAACATSTTLLGCSR